ncbi:CoxG family protein [Natronomonas salsuginis]|jgi:carbon monoxide dehydrogenase subunit G|uniref:Polyketide cyclase n=1 Tax=Natronomonas salsuginis TaxID=2217661 RepID=A0A4U5J701_9EURY|nr:SRPBCC family protein [Natronomonas salsuginis]TKR24802.1 polyketide cyclase [Natronomonas salsuginis]
MTTRVERVFEIPASREAVWAAISDPETRARSISVVTEFETTGDRTSIWHVSLPIPGISRTISVETEDIEVDEPEYVRFVGRSKAMNVEGEHTLEAIEGGTRLTNRFRVEGRLPGVESYFKRKLDGELANLEATVREELDA